MQGTFKTKNGEVINPATIADSVTVTIEGTQYPLSTVINSIESALANLQANQVTIETGTTDLEAGVSELDTGKIYICYEE